MVSPILYTNVYNEILNLKQFIPLQTSHETNEWSSSLEGKTPKALKRSRDLMIKENQFSNKFDPA
jgi:hypothetical protein